MLILSEQVSHTLFTDGEALVMIGGELLRLGPVAAFILSRCDTPITFTDLIHACETEFGTPPQGNTAEAVKEILAELIQLGILREIET